MPELVSKNNALNPEENIWIEQEIFILSNSNNTSDYKEVTHDINQNYVQFHFCIKEQASLLFHQGGYVVTLQEQKTLLLYNPQHKLPLHLRLHPKAQVISVCISIQKLHSLFSSESDFIDFLNPENQDKKYYSEDTITSQMEIILHQIANTSVYQKLYKLYLKGKIYELLSLFFSKSMETEQCPFLSDENSVQKIRKAKEIVIEHLTSPPSLQQLADQVGIPLKKLTIGFKQVYGESVYNFLFDYKMELARKLLESKQYNINELSLKLGYSTPSHFISAFKKKFSTTPKKYLMGKS